MFVVIGVEDDHGIALVWWWDDIGITLWRVDSSSFFAQ